MTTSVAQRVLSTWAHTSVGATAAVGRVPVPSPATPSWAWGEATGRGVTVCVIDSGVDTGHPLLAGVRPYAVTTDAPGTGQDPVGWTIVNDDAGDEAGHGTACAGIIRSLAPECELVSVRVLGRALRGSGQALVTALEWAVEQHFEIVNLSLSTRRPAFRDRIRDLVDQAFFAGTTVVAAAHNSPVASYPWRFPAVLSVGAHGVDDPLRVEFNPVPPVEFFAAGTQVEVPWPGGGTRRVSGNSFAAPHISGMCARILQRHPGLAATQVKHILASIASNLVPGAPHVPVD